MWHATDCPVCGRDIETPWLARQYPDDPTKLIITAYSRACLDQAVARTNRVLHDTLEMLKRPIEPQYFHIKRFDVRPVTTVVPEQAQGTKTMEWNRTFEPLLRAQDPNFSCAYAGDVVHVLDNATPGEWTRFCYTIRYKNQKFSLDELTRQAGSGQIYYLVHTCYRDRVGASALVATRDVCTPDNLVVQMEELLSRITWMRTMKAP